ncbi:hypothetical protein NT6N_07790 [Oceaniferula spumae]|uniref:LamG-like jellyroll fold domain-containing protein n=1 Tax=Oceaniferula spumae TaxID=2979115 RepID=A0AAT9FIB9_9BACT
MKSQITFFLAIASTCTISQAALVGYWNMNETGGNLADSSGNNLTGIKQTAGPGSVYGQATVTPGTYGALTVSSSVTSHFDKSIDFAVNTTNNRSNYNLGTPALIGDLVSAAGGGTGTFTLMAWINPDSTTGTQRIFGTGVGGVSGWAFGTNGSTLRFTTNGRQDNNSPTAAGLTVGTWAHIAMTYNNNIVEFFLNGNSLGIDADAGGFNEETANNYRFGSTSNGQEQFIGEMDELKIYDEVLSISQIRAAAVPEPSSTALLGLGGLALILRRKK